jgi:hypothetical protein
MFFAGLWAAAEAISNPGTTNRNLLVRMPRQHIMMI